MIVRSRAPLRISFGGGGTDVPPYCQKYGGVTLNSTINMYTNTTWELSNEPLLLDSADLGLRKKIENIGSYHGDYDLIEATLKLTGINEKLHKGTINMSGDAPIGTGLGTSSSAVVSLLGAIWDVTGRSINEPLNLSRTKYEIANLACKIEREELKIPGGYQDQYVSTFGGFNWTEYNKSGEIEVVPLRISDSIIAELESRALLIYTGSTRIGGDIIRRQQKAFEKGQNIEQLDNLKQLAFGMRRALGKGDVTGLAELLHESWLQKRQVAEGTSTPAIDRLYKVARKNGARGGKIAGAGGGGAMLLIVDNPEQRQIILNELQKVNQSVQRMPFSFDKNGLYTWRGE